MHRLRAIVDRSFLTEAKVEDAGVVVDPSLAFTHRALQRVAARQPIRFCGHVRFEDKRWLMGETLMAPLGDSVVRMIFCAFAAWHDLAEKS
jgi:hypothetical protein